MIIEEVDWKPPSQTGTKHSEALDVLRGMKIGDAVRIYHGKLRCEDSYCSLRAAVVAVNQYTDFGLEIYHEKLGVAVIRRVDSKERHLKTEPAEWNGGSDARHTGMREYLKGMLVGQTIRFEHRYTSCDGKHKCYADNALYVLRREGIVLNSYHEEPGVMIVRRIS